MFSWLPPFNDSTSINAFSEVVNRLRAGDGTVFDETRKGFEKHFCMAKGNGDFVMAVLDTEKGFIASLRDFVDR